MRILVNGTSISRGPETWPYYIEEKLGTQIVNLAQAGSGNTYLHESTVSELGERPYDLVIIQWAYVNRLDFRVHDIAKFRDSTYTSEFQAKQNDWKGKVIIPVNDQDYVQKNWIFGCGYINEQLDDSIGRVFKEYYKITTANEHMFASLIKMISLQNTLKQLNIPYVFKTIRPFTKFDRYNNLYKLIDWNNFYDGTPILTVARENSIDGNGGVNDTGHPLPYVHKIYADSFYKFLVERQLV